jgi:uncharacterized membrane protein (DUF2068 family)
MKNQIRTVAVFDYIERYGVWVGGWVFACVCVHVYCVVHVYVVCSHECVFVVYLSISNNPC